MKKFWLSLFFLYGLSSASALQVSISAKAAILINPETDAILFEKNGFKQIYPASLTKVATALYALNQMGDRLDESTKCPKECLISIPRRVKEAHHYTDPAYYLQPDGDFLGIKPGETYSMETLLHALMMKSANDAANMMGVLVSGDLLLFMDGMNHYLKGIGCQNTHFDNPHGLDIPSHMSTPYDLSLMAKEALKSPLLRQIIKKIEYTCPKTKRQGAKKIFQTNHLVKKGKYFYPHAIGMKTGHTKFSGFSIMAVAEKDGRTLIAVIIGCESRKDRYRDAVALFDAAFAEKEESRLLFNHQDHEFTIKLSGAKHPLQAILLDDYTYQYYSSEEQEIKTVLDWKELTLPIHKQAQVANIRLVNQRGSVIDHIPLYAKSDVKSTLRFRIRRILREVFAEQKYLRNLFLGFMILCALFLLKKVRQFQKRIER